MEGCSSSNDSGFKTCAAHRAVEEHHNTVGKAVFTLRGRAARSEGLEHPPEVPSPCDNSPDTPDDVPDEDCMGIEVQYIGRLPMGYIRLTITLCRYLRPLCLPHRMPAQRRRSRGTSVPSPHGLAAGGRTMNS